VTQRPVLVIGATGYVGGRLVPRLLEAGYRVRAVTRSLAKLGCRPWTQDPRCEVVQGDVLARHSIMEAARGCGVLYYLASPRNTATGGAPGADRLAAQNVVSAAGACHLERIIYLGGPEREDSTIRTADERSQGQVARILREGAVPATILRAAMILGSGSVSFEILRYLVERQRVMVIPRWAGTPCQPIAIRDVLHYLLGCLERAETVGQSYDIGGPDILSCRRLMEICREEAGIPERKAISIPLVIPRLSAAWIHLVTPVPASLARPFIEVLRHPAVCREHRIRAIMPRQLLGSREAIRAALERSRHHQVETCWADAGAISPPEWASCGDAEYAGGTILQCGYRMRLKAAPETIWPLITRVGGRTGWYYGNFLWHLRGWLDRCMGGIGLRGGRRHPVELYVGDALDFWRVLEIESPKRLLLLAEMMVPGEALLEFRVEPWGNGESEVLQLSRFLPRGLGGILYWYTLYPFHQWIFRGMLDTIARSCQAPVVRGVERFTPKLQPSCRITSGTL
jgi:uncharacterized protein YbjT (DUF2867 family)